MALRGKVVPRGSGRQRRDGALKMCWTKPWPRRPLWGLNRAAGVSGRFGVLEKTEFRRRRKR